MARIRTIKPEFWDSPNVAAASACARLAYIAMWGWVDDSGVGTMNEKELEGYIFPNDDIPLLSNGKLRNFRELVAEVSKCFEIEFYRVKKRPYFRVVNFDKHQRNERKTKGRHPGPEQADNGEIWRNYEDFLGNALCFREPVAENDGISALGTGEQGNRGTDKYICSIGAETPIKRARIKHDYTEAFEQFWKTYPRREGKRKAAAAFDRALKRAPLETIMDGAARYANDPNRVDQYTKHAERWLNSDGWDDDPLPERAPRKETTTDRMIARAIARDQQKHATAQTPPAIAFTDPPF